MAMVSFPLPRRYAMRRLGIGVGLFGLVVILSGIGKEMNSGKVDRDYPKAHRRAVDHRGPMRDTGGSEEGCRYIDNLEPRSRR